MKCSLICENEKRRAEGLLEKPGIPQNDPVFVNMKKITTHALEYMKNHRENLAPLRTHVIFSP